MKEKEAKNFLLYYYIIIILIYYMYSIIICYYMYSIVLILLKIVDNADKFLTLEPVPFKLLIAYERVVK